MTIAAGEAYWGIVPYTPAAPFAVHVSDAAPVEVPTAAQIVDGLRRGGDAEFGFVVRAKARPVLLLSDRSDPRTGDLFALRLLRLGKLTEEERRLVREQRDPHLFHLRPKRFPGLAEDCAAMVSAPIRLLPASRTVDPRRKSDAGAIRWTAPASLPTSSHRLTPRWVKRWISAKRSYREGRLKVLSPPTCPDPGMSVRTRRTPQ